MQPSLSSVAGLRNVKTVKHTVTTNSWPWPQARARPASTVDGYGDHAHTERPRNMNCPPGSTNCLEQLVWRIERGSKKVVSRIETKTHIPEINPVCMRVRKNE